MMISRKVKILAATAISLSFVLVTVGNGCSKRDDIGSANSSAAAGDTTNTGSDNGAPPSDFIPGARTASVVYAKQALDQLTSCAGVSAPSDATLLMFENKKSSMSTYGDANSVTPPMMMAVTTVAGEICNDLINQERAVGATPRIFVGWDLASNNLPSANLVGNSISRLAVSCWQKQESTAERDLLLGLLGTVANGSAGAQQRSALLLCTAVLSSLNSLLN